MALLNQGAFDPNRHSTLIGVSTIDQATIYPLTGIPLATNTVFALTTAIVDASGNQITSFGGGTQYTDGGTPPTHPVGPALEFNNAGAWATAGTSNPLPVNLYAQGTALQQSGGNLLVNVQNFAIGTYGNSDGTAANLTSALSFSEGLLYNGTTWDRWRGDTTSGAWVNVKNSSIAVTGTFWQTTQPISIADGSDTTLGAKADAKSTATDTTAVSIVSILKEISYMEQNPASRAVTGTFWQATQPISIASGGVASGAIASGAIASGAAVSGAFADGSIVTLGAKTDAKSTATDGTSTSIVSILKEISAMEQAPASRAVTNTGTFAVQNTESTTLPSYTTAPDSVAIAASSSGDNTIISAPGAAKTIYVYAYSISFNGTVNAKFTDGASGTNKAGLFYGVANAGAANSVRPPYYLFKCSANTALVLNLSGATAVGGHVSYFVI